MYAALDKSDVSIPMYVARRVDRIPPCPINVNIKVHQNPDLSGMLTNISSCLAKIEKHLNGNLTPVVVKPKLLLHPNGPI